MARSIPKLVSLAALAGLLFGMAAPALAQDTDTPVVRPRPKITIHPRTNQPGPNSKRYCRSWLEQEYRVSGTVIVPRMQCWWQ
jgi:hypothetical protein